MTETNALPLTIGDKVIGTVVLNYETGELTGKLFDRVLVNLLEGYLGAGMLSIGFFGKPGVGVNIIEGQAEFAEYLSKSENETIEDE